MFYFIKEGLLKCGFYLQGGLYLEVACNTGLTTYYCYPPPRKPSIVLFSRMRSDK